jgi:hypothetical protein
VKVNESVPEEGPHSSLSVDESFVVLERSPPQELNQYASFMSEQSAAFPVVPPQNSYTGSITRTESQVSILLHCAAFSRPHMFLQGVSETLIVRI